MYTYRTLITYLVDLENLQSRHSNSKTNICTNNTSKISHISAISTHTQNYKTPKNLPEKRKLTTHEPVACVLYLTDLQKCTQPQQFCNKKMIIFIQKSFKLIQKTWRSDLLHFFRNNLNWKIALVVVKVKEGVFVACKKNMGRS